MRLAIVVPRYGERVLGGAETLARQLAERLSHSEFDVDLLTTCAHDMHTWRNVYPPGAAQSNGVRVRRFPIDHHLWNERRHRELMHKFANREPTTVDEEYEWIDNSAHSPALYGYLLQHGNEYDLLIFTPYLFGVTFYGMSLLPERSILLPCLHDEPFARFLQTRLMMESCRGLLFISAPEMTLAQDKLGIRNPGARLVGFGLDDHQSNGERFRRRFGLHDPFLLYTGRLDGMKNLLELFSFFGEYKRLRPGPLKLVLMGDGPLPVPTHPDVIPLGFLPEQDKLDGYNAATILCQPSLMESFSIVLMEAWLSETPALVHGDCDVTRDHVRRSNGGLYYTDFDEFTGALDWLIERPTERARMGKLGRAYVRAEYNWETVLDRFRDAVKTWQQPSRTLELKQ